MVVDRHYFGIFTEMHPPVVMTTTQINYHKEQNIPFRTIQDINYEYRLADERRAKGLPMIWEEQRAKDMELYPLIEPLVNFTKEKVLHISEKSHKIATFIKNGGRRLEEVAVEKDAEA